MRPKLPDLHIKVVQDTSEKNSEVKLILLDPQAKLEEKDKISLVKLGIKPNFTYKEIEIG